MKEFSEKELLLLGYLEGDLSDSEREKFEAMMVEDAALMAEYRQLARTKLPAPQVAYANKASLKRTATPPTKKPVLGYILWPAAVAASIALLFWFISPSSTTDSTLTATGSTQIIVQTPENTRELLPQTNNTVKEREAYLEDNATKENKQAKATEVLQKQSKNSFQKTTKKENSTKQLIISDELLAAKTISIKVTNSTIPVVETIVETGIYTPYTPSASDERGWLARTTHKINNQLGTLVGYVQKPQVDINKKEEANGGRTYWAITLETEKYEWEGRLLYTRR